MEKTTCLKIAFVGPEATGKSTLANHLALHFNVSFVEEYAREYVQQHKHEPQTDDIIKIAREQLKRDAVALQNYSQKIIFFDTSYLTLKIWAEDISGTCPSEILNMFYQNKIDFYLLTFPDIPWKDDGVRKDALRREHFFNENLKQLKDINAAYAVVKGKGMERQENAEAFIRDFIKKRDL